MTPPPLHHLGRKMGFLVYFYEKGVYLIDFDLLFEILVYVVWEWYTHENKGMSPYLQVMVVKKYLHTQAQTYSLLKAQYMCKKLKNLRAFCKVCGCAFVCKYFLTRIPSKYRAIPLFSWVSHFHTTYTTFLMSKSKSVKNTTKKP